MIRLCLWLLAPAIFAVLSTTASADTFKRIKDETVFRSVIVGKQLTWLDGDGTVKVRKNGKISGKFDGERLVGMWVWQQGHFCRRVQLGNNAPREACQKVHATSDAVRFTSTTGNRVTTYSY